MHKSKVNYFFTILLYTFSETISWAKNNKMGHQGIIQKKSACGSRTLPCLEIFFEILFWSEYAKNGL